MFCMLEVRLAHHQPVKCYCDYNFVVVVTAVAVLLLFVVDSRERSYCGQYLTSSVEQIQLHPVFLLVLILVFAQIGSAN